MRKNVNTISSKDSQWFKDSRPVRSLQFESIATSLKGKNVKFFKEPKEESFGKHAIIEDPDGHLISIAEIKSAPTEGFDLMGLIGAE